MLHVAERVRLLRQGDHREIIALEAALKKVLRNQTAAGCFPPASRCLSDKKLC